MARRKVCNCKCHDDYSKGIVHPYPCCGNMNGKVRRPKYYSLLD